MILEIFYRGCLITEVELPEMGINEIDLAYRVESKMHQAEDFFNAKALNPAIRPVKHKVEEERPYTVTDSKSTGHYRTKKHYLHDVPKNFREQQGNWKHGKNKVPVF